MGDETTSGTKQIPWLGLVLAGLVILIGGWVLLRRYSTAAARECVALYREALSASDTARIDTTVVSASLRESDPRSCGSMRSSSRWR